MERKTCSSKQVKITPRNVSCLHDWISASRRAPPTPCPVWRTWIPIRFGLMACVESSRASWNIHPWPGFRSPRPCSWVRECTPPIPVGSAQRVAIRDCRSSPWPFPCPTFHPSRWPSQRRSPPSAPDPSRSRRLCKRGRPERQGWQWRGMRRWGTAFFCGGKRSLNRKRKWKSTEQSRSPLEPSNGP